MNLAVVLSWYSRDENLPDHKIIELRAGSKQDCISSIVENLGFFHSYAGVDWAMDYLEEVSSRIVPCDLPGGISLDPDSPLVDGWEMVVHPDNDLILYYVAWN